RDGLCESFMQRCQLQWSERAGDLLDVQTLGRRSDIARRVVHDLLGRVADNVADRRREGPNRVLLTGADVEDFVVEALRQLPENPHEVIDQNDLPLLVAVPPED